jgi:hypothetical protein
MKFHYAVVEVGGGVFKRLPNVLIVQFWVFNSKLFPIGIGCQCFQHSPHREAHPANAWLAIEDGWIGCDTIKRCHRFRTRIVAALYYTQFRSALHPQFALSTPTRTRPSYVKHAGMG